MNVEELLALTDKEKTVLWKTTIEKIRIFFSDEVSSGAYIHSGFSYYHRRDVK